MTLSPGEYERGVQAYWAEIATRAPDVQRREREFPRFAESFASRVPPHFELPELEGIMRWKHTDARWRDRALRGLAAVPPSHARSVTSGIDHVEDAAAAYRLLKGFAYGVGIASISAILAAARPASFPVIDVFALAALLKHVPERWHSLMRFDKFGRPIAEERVYPPFVDTCRRLSSQLRSETGHDHWTPRRVDMALWGIGRDLYPRNAPSSPASGQL